MVSDITLGKAQPTSTPVIYVTDVIDWASFFKSTNEGISWVDLDENFPPGITHTPRVTVCEPDDPDRVYIGCVDDGVWKSVMFQAK